MGVALVEAARGVAAQAEGAPEVAGPVAAVRGVEEAAEAGVEQKMPSPR